jgi:hypothetical protein
MRVALLLALVMPLTAAAQTAQTPPRPASPVKGVARDRFVFRIGFWTNLHHFLYVLGRAKNGDPLGQRPPVIGAPKDLEGLSDRSPADRAAWDEAIAFYAAGPSKKDVVFDKDLVAQTRALAATQDTADLPSTVDPPLAAALRKAAPIYRAVWWPRHLRADAARRDELQKLVAEYGERLVSRVTAVYLTKWPDTPRTIDLTAYSNWAGAYSTDGGLIVVNSLDQSTAGSMGLETLLHEASHQWDEEIDARVAAIAAKVGRKVPGILSHAMIFYTSGEIVKEVIPGHVPTAEQSGIWRRSAGMVKPQLDRYWLPYLKGQGTFDEAVAAMLSMP